MLVAILLVALATIIAAAVGYENAMTARRGAATLSLDDAILIGEGAEALAGYGLRAVLQSNGKAPDVYPAQAWAQPVGPLEVAPGVMLEASLEDLQGRFNLNSLIANDGKDLPDPEAVKAFRQLLAICCNIEEKWADLLVDWIDQNAQTQPDGAEDSTYLGQNPPYLPPDKFITSASELLALPGFGQERYAKLAPYVTALPPGTPLNICSAPAYVLDAFLGGTRQFSTDLEGFAKTRVQDGACYPTLNYYQSAFTSAPVPYATVAQVSGGVRFATTSSYFRLTSLVTIGTTEFNLYSLLYMDGNTPLKVHPVMRSFTPD
jgi:general secretion pathway protein K